MQLLIYNCFVKYFYTRFFNSLSFCQPKYISIHDPANIPCQQYNGPWAPDSTQSSPPVQRLGSVSQLSISSCSSYQRAWWWRARPNMFGRPQQSQGQNRATGSGSNRQAQVRISVFSNGEGLGPNMFGRPLQSQCQNRATSSGSNRQSQVFIWIVNLVM